MPGPADARPWPGPGRSPGGSRRPRGRRSRTPRATQTSRRTAAGPASASSGRPRPYAAYSGGEPEDAVLERFGWLVLLIVAKWAPHPAMRDDLVQEGRIGLWKAARKFDPSRGVKFVSYAGHLILGEMLHWVRDNAAAVRTPRTEWDAGRRAVVTSLDALTEPDPAHGSPTIPRELWHEERGFQRAEMLADLARLPQLRRGAVLLVHLGGMTQTEAARALGCSQRHVGRLAAGIQGGVLA